MQTPFTLTGSATDPELDPLTFCWEEFDLGTAAPPNDDAAAARPIFRSFHPTVSPSRTFPKLANVLSGTATFGESMSQRARTMTFRLTARDNKVGGGGVAYAFTTVTIDATAGPFTVTAPTNGAVWNGGTPATVTWNVAGTTGGTVSCANVHILLSSDGGNTFPTTLVAATANDGTETFTVPTGITTAAARVRVECATNIFFDISRPNFTINQAAASTSTLTIPSSASIHGNGGAFFHSDLWAMNRSYANTLTVTAKYRCFTGQSCGSATKSFQLGPRQSILYTDVVGAGLFASPETAGAIELTYDALVGQLSAGSRVYTPSLPEATYGTAVPALPASEARTRTLFLSLGANGGVLTGGFRSNAGAYNPNASAVDVTFTLYNGATGTVLGVPVTRTWAANEAFQLADIFTVAGAGSSVTTNAYLVVTATAPVFPFVTVIDNKSSDSVWGVAGSDEAP
jgi:hypothetical protein